MDASGTNIDTDEIPQVTSIFNLSIKFTHTLEHTMITADRIRKGAWLNAEQIEKLIRKAYPKDMILSATFLGVSNGGQFVYECGYPDPERAQRLGPAKTKVFVWENDLGSLVADY